MTTDIIRAALEAATEYGEGDDSPLKPEDIASGEFGEFPLTDIGNAELFSLLYGERVRYDHMRHRWLIFDAHHWREDLDGEIRRMAFETARTRKVIAAHIRDADKSKRAFAWASHSQSRPRVEAMVDFAKSLHPIADRGDGWDANPDLLGVANGVVDLRTGRLRGGTPADRITLIAPVAYDEDAEAPTWLSAIDAMMEGDRALLTFLQAALGYSLTGHTREQVFFVLHGSGANGKSVTLNVARTVAGGYGHNLPFTALEQSARSQSIAADIAQLPGRRLVTSSETSDSTRLYESRIKALTGSDPITAAEKFKAPFTFKPVAKLWLATNHLPTVHDDSHGFWRRMRVIPFRHQFRGDELDPGIEAKIQDELPGTLRWMVEGAVRWYAEGLRAPESVRLATEVYRSDSDPLADFITERCLVSEAAQSPAGHLYKIYLNWANEHGLGRETLSSTVFGKRMGERFTKAHTRTGKVYQGVGIAFQRDGLGTSGNGFEVQFDGLSREPVTASSSPETRHADSEVVTRDGLGGHSAEVGKTPPHVGGDTEKRSQPVTPSPAVPSCRCRDCGDPIPGGHARCGTCAAAARAAATSSS